MARSRQNRKQLNLTMTAYTNPGSGGGSGYYIDLGGMKILIITGVSLSNVAWRDVTFPVGLFSSAPLVVANSQESVSPSGWIETAAHGSSGGAPNTTGAALLARTSTSTNASSTCNLMAVGI